MEHIQITENDLLPDIRRLAPFKAVFAIEDSVNVGRQHEICNWIVNMGC